MKQNNDQTGSIMTRHSVILDYLELTKPVLTLLSVFTAVCSSLLAMQASPHYYLLVHTFFGTSLVGGAAGALNQFIEQHSDALMKRTGERPLPSGRIQARHALIFGVCLATIGVIYLIIAANYFAGLLAAATLIIYLFIYTPLKKRSPFAYMIGGIPGAIPPLIGWVVVRGSLTIESLYLFLILYFWQLPHFLSISWIFRKDYALAGYKMLSVIDTTGIRIGRYILIYSIILIPISLLPSLIGSKGLLYSCGALVLSAGLLTAAYRMFKERSGIAARMLFLTSLSFLPLMFLLLVTT
jgi:protoheme IX farnesyltransferase